MISISGVFAVTFSVVFAYVADVTTIENRSRAYGMVSATFAASLVRKIKIFHSAPSNLISLQVISPALGAYLNDMYSEPLIVALATAVAVLDVFFILVAVPESLPEKVRPNQFSPISWEQADPFAALRRVGMNHTIMMQCITVLLSYLPEAGQYSCIFVYLKLKMHFSSMDVSIFIAVVGILSIVAQMVLGDLMRVLGAKRTIIIGLTFEMLQMLWYGIGTQTWMMVRRAGSSVGWKISIFFIFLSSGAPVCSRLWRPSRIQRSQRLCRFTRTRISRVWCREW